MNYHPCTFLNHSLAWNRSLEELSRFLKELSCLVREELSSLVATTTFSNLSKIMAIFMLGKMFQVSVPPWKIAEDPSVPLCLRKAKVLLQSHFPCVWKPSSRCFEEFYLNPFLSNRITYLQGFYIRTFTGFEEIQREVLYLQVNFQNPNTESFS